MSHEYIPLVMLLVFGGVLGAVALLSDAATRLTRRQEADKLRREHSS